MLHIKHNFWFGSASAIGALAVDRFLPSLSDLVGFVLAGVAVLFYAVGAWGWAKRYQAIAQQNRRREAVYLRLAASGLVVAVGALLLVVVYQLVPKPPLNLTEQAMLERYRRFYVNSEAPNKTTMIEMTNSELKTRGTKLYTRIKAMNAHWAQVTRDRKAREERGEIGADESGRLWLQEMAEHGKEFEDNYRVDARMVLLELKNRIPREARKHIMGLPDINPADKRDGKVSLYDVFPADWAVNNSGQLALEIEELVKLLPDND